MVSSPKTPSPSGVAGIVFQSRNREAYGFKAIRETLSKTKRQQFQSRNREAYGFK